MDPTRTRTLGTTGVEVTELGFGGASIGELFVRVSEVDAAATLATAWASGIRYFDTAPWYGRGLSELRTGAGLRDHARSEFALSTKVGRYLRPATREGFDGSPWLGGSPNEVVFDYTYDGIMRSVEQSRLRLGITRFDVAFIHDLDHLYFDDATIDAHFRDLAGSGWKALEELRASGQIGAIGAGINELGMIPRFLEHRGHRRLPDRDAVHPARPGRARRGVPGLRGARHRVRDRCRVRLRGPGQGAGAGRQVRLRGRLAGGPRPDASASRPSASGMASRWRRQPSSSRWATHRSPASSRAPRHRPSRPATSRPSATRSRPICGRNSSTKACSGRMRRSRHERAAGPGSRPRRGMAAANVVRHRR